MYLWSGTLSPFSAKVRIVLAEKGLPIEIREVPWSRQNKWHPKPKAFLDVSPRGEVPVLVDGGLAVFDSWTNGTRCQHSAITPQPSTSG
ncbi:MAG: glutathione S-transferase N-terminal domain-containing protein [Proteobacteria bacterium]|nr:glutathione S-transferase N-terminal domain-containing protein [Pseudomonadota bacterium]